MLTENHPFLLPTNIEVGLSAKLRALADDLDRIASGGGPTERQRLEAPLLNNWRTTIDVTGLRLIGFVAGHPLLRTGPAMTSQLWIADPSGRWVRTLSRYYRLGRPDRGRIDEGMNEEFFRDV